MLKYLLLMPLELVIMVFCYITNPIVVLFCDKNGELPGVLHLWQTWDDSCDSFDFMTKYVPSFLKYDYNEKYIHSIIYLDKYKCTRNISTLKDDATFTFKEKIQQYFCRVMWLTRNCGYGFAYFIFGSIVDADTTELKWEKTVDTYKGTFYLDTSKNILITPFRFKCTLPICKWLRWEVYLGWKMQSKEEHKKNFPDTKDSKYRCMIANRITFRFMK